MFSYNGHTWKAARTRGIKNLISDSNFEQFKWVYLIISLSFMWSSKRTNILGRDIFLLLLSLL